MSAKTETRSQSVVLFDGVCNLCNDWVNFVIDRDQSATFRFASLQSDEARELLESIGHELAIKSGPETILLVDSGQVYEKSDAVLRILAGLGRGWAFSRLLRIIPRFVRDAVYDIVARNRYSWFGRTEVCRVPTEDLQSRFL